VTEAAIMMNAVAAGGGGSAAMSTLQINLFAPHPIVVLGTPEQKRRMLRPLISGAEKTCFGVTEADAGLNTTRIKTSAKRVDGGYLVNGSKIWTSTAQEADNILLLTRTTPLEDCVKSTDGMTIFFTKLNREKIEVRRIPKMGRAAVDSNAIFIQDLFIPEEDRIGEEGKGFGYLLHSLNPDAAIRSTARLVDGPSRSSEPLAAIARSHRINARANTAGSTCPPPSMSSCARRSTCSVSSVTAPAGRPAAISWCGPAGSRPRIGPYSALMAARLIAWVGMPRASPIARPRRAPYARSSICLLSDRH
jgi:hypothetical protein